MSDTSSPFAVGGPGPREVPGEPTDEELCERAAAGSREALADLVRRHQRWIYNVALRLVLSPADADDLAQEALVKIVTRLAQFAGRSRFRTWAYRIVVNCFLDGKKRPLEQAITTFAAYGDELDKLPLAPLERSGGSDPEQALLVEEARVGCMLGMLLCLDREQRAVYVLGEIFEAPAPVASELFDITPAAFRKRLERARRDLTSFMNDKCGLVHEANPCRCDKKTRAFIDAGWVDPARLKFTGPRVERLRAEAPARSRELCALEEQYAQLFRQHPVLDGPDLAARLDKLLDDPGVRRTFDFD